MGSIVHRSVPTNLKWFPNCSHAHALFQDRFKDVQVGSRCFSTLYILSPNFHRRLISARSRFISYSLRRSSSSCNVLSRWIHRCLTAPSMWRGHPTGICDSSRSPSPFCSIIVLSNMNERCGDLVSRTCLAGAKSATSHSARNSMTLFSSLGRASWTAWNADSMFGVCDAVGLPSKCLAYSSAKKRRHILETHWDFKPKDLHVAWNVQYVVVFVLHGWFLLCTTASVRKVSKAQTPEARQGSNLFFHPTPSWLSPGRYTRSTAAKR